jgi:hypothetical protein
VYKDQFAASNMVKADADKDLAAVAAQVAAAAVDVKTCTAK